MKACSFGRPSWPMGRVKVNPLDSDWLAKKATPAVEIFFLHSCAS